MSRCSTSSMQGMHVCVCVCVCTRGVRGCEIPRGYCVETVGFLVHTLLCFAIMNVRFGSCGCNQKGMGMAI